MKLTLADVGVVCGVGVVPPNVLFAGHVGRKVIGLHEDPDLAAAAMAKYVLATIHPSAILRVRTAEERDAAKQDLVRDLVLVSNRIRRSAQRSDARLF